MHSHLSSNYTTTLIPLGVELIARVQTWCSCLGLLLLRRSLGSCLLEPDNNSNHTWRSLSAPEIRPCGLSKVHIELKAEQRRGGAHKEKPPRRCMSRLGVCVCAWNLDMLVFLFHFGSQRMN